MADTPPKPRSRWGLLPVLCVFLTLSTAMLWLDRSAGNERRWILEAVQRGITIKPHSHKIAGSIPDVGPLKPLLRRNHLAADLDDDADVERLLKLPAPDPRLCLWVGSAVSFGARERLKKRFVGAIIEEEP